MTSVLTQARAAFHAGLVSSGVLSIDAGGVPSNADRSNRASVALAQHLAAALGVGEAAPRRAGQSLGGDFEKATAGFLEATFPLLQRVRPGTWSVRAVGSARGVSPVAQFVPYTHLAQLDALVRANPALATVLGNAYAITPDVVITRAPLSTAELNADGPLVDDAVGQYSELRASNQSNEILHAVISCKWTLRSDRAQNARSEALNLVRNRKGRLPHVVVVTGEPTPSRLSSLALGTGDIDCIYHFALPELIAAVQAQHNDATSEALSLMIEGHRLKDISDLPLDLAV